MYISTLKIKYIFFAVAMVFVTNTLYAAQTKEVEALLKTNLDKVFAILKNKSLDQEKKTSEIVKIVSPMFDFPLITKLSFGKKYWTGMTNAQQDQFVTLFVDLLKKSFIEKLVLYTDEKIVIKDPIDKKNKVEIPTVLVSEGKNFDMTYKFYKSKENNWKIWDLEIQDISIIKTYQSQIDQVLQKGTYDELMQKLQKPE